MNLEFTEIAWDDFGYWLKHDKQIVNKILSLTKSIIRSPFEGLGKPEPLKNEFKGCWSRRINLEQRLVYMIKEDENKVQRCIILQCRYQDEK